MTPKIPRDRVDAIGLAADALEYVTRVQLEDRDPSHEDFHSLHAGIVRTLQNLIDLTGVLARQMPRYGEHRILRADNAEQGGDPYQQIAEAGRLASETENHLELAYQAANKAWSTIGHVGVAADPNAITAQE